MDLAYLDYLATSGKSFLHRFSVGLKIVLFLIFIGAIISIQQVLSLVIILLFLYGLIFLARLPFKKIFLISLYPMIFALIFAFASMGKGWEWFFIILLRVLATATTMILLFATTPYPCIFSNLGKVLPGFLIPIFFMTYRSIFILFSIFENIRTGFKLRGGFQIKHPKRSLFNFAKAIGYLILKGMDDSQRFYEGIKLRGFEGKIEHQRRFCTWTRR